MTDWISVQDRLPEEFVPVLVCRKNRQGGQIIEAGQRDIPEEGGLPGKKEVSFP